MRPFSIIQCWVGGFIAGVVLLVLTYYAGLPPSGGVAVCVFVWYLAFLADNICAAIEYGPLKR